MSDAPEELGLDLPPLRRRLVGGTAWATAGRLFVALTALGVNALVTRILDPADAGTFFLAQSAVTLGVLFAQSGLQRVATRFVAQALAEGNPGRARAAVGTVLRSGWLLCVGLAALAAVPPFARAVGAVFDATRIGDVMWLVGVALAVRALTILRAETFRGFQDMARATIFGGVDAGALTVLLLGALWFLAPSRGSLHVVVGVTAVAWVPSLVVSSLLLRRRADSLRGAGHVAYREVFVVAWPVFAGGLGTFLMSQADLWVVGAKLEAADVAVYGAALRLTMLVTIPLQIVNAVVPPIIAELYAKGDRMRMQRVLRVTATLAGIPAAGVLLAFIVAGGPILGLVYGDFYAQGGTVLALLSAGSIVSVWAGSCGPALTMTRHERANMVFSLAGGVALVVAALLVAEPFGITAVAVAGGTLLALRNIVGWIAARRLLGVYTHAGIGPALVAIRTVRKGRGIREQLLGES